MMTAREHDDRKGHHYYTRLRTPCLRGLGSGGAGPQYISQKTFCESNEAASGSKALQECHPERSEGSLARQRSFAALRMTAVLKLKPMGENPAQVSNTSGAEHVCRLLEEQSLKSWPVVASVQCSRQSQRRYRVQRVD